MTPDALSAALEAALLRELRTQIAWQNHVRFARKLKPPVLVLSDSTRRLGQWSRNTRRLELSRALVLARPWAEVISVLEHELAHQFVDEVLKIHDEASHGPTFQKVCAERGIDARAAGMPEPSSAPAPAAERVL
ncbi:MAG: SprT-like domain-containing protein, partial [Deltaproteobacteria bacterium]|nr:SprT-like domain-containing protein [Deltaproteobacteria bacterium]